MKRRALFRLLAAAAAAPAAVLAARAEVPPKLWGDGVHDDTAALQWRIDRNMPIDGGTFLITSTLYAGEAWTSYIRGAVVVADDA